MQNVVHVCSVPGVTKLQKAFKRAGRSAATVALRVGCSSVTASEVRARRRKIGLELAFRFAKVLEIDVRELPLTDEAREALEFQSPSATAESATP